MILLARIRKIAQELGNVVVNVRIYGMWMQVWPPPENDGHQESIMVEGV